MLTIVLTGWGVRGCSDRSGPNPVHGNSHPRLGPNETRCRSSAVAATTGNLGVVGCRTNSLPGVTSRPKGIRPGHVFRSASRLSLVSLLGVVLTIPTTFLIAMQLGSEDYSDPVRIARVLIRHFDSPWHLQAGVRAFIYHTSREDQRAATLAQNVGITYDTAFALLPRLVLLAATPFLEDPLRQLGFMLAPVATLIASLSAF